MQERLRSVGWAPHTTKLRTDQIADRKTWAQIPNGGNPAKAAMWSINVQPKNASTETTINPLDPGGDNSFGYVEIPGAQGLVPRTGIWGGWA